MESGLWRCLQSWQASPAPPPHLVPVHQPEAQQVLQLAQADGAEVQGPAQGLVHAERALHEAAEPAAVPQAQKVTQLVARDLRETGPPPCSLEPAAHQNPGTPGEGGHAGRKASAGGLAAWRFGHQREVK